jgi:hypothetical protein
VTHEIDVCPVADVTSRQPNHVKPFDVIDSPDPSDVDRATSYRTT